MRFWLALELSLLGVIPRPSREARVSHSTLETISRALTMSKTKAGGWDAREVDMRLRVE